MEKIKMQTISKIDDSVYTAVALHVNDPQTDGFIEQTFCGIEEPPHLTTREAEILRLIISGKTNKEIAQRICRVERTVEYHRNHLMRKLNAHSISELFKKAISIGILPL
jgi:DNA-binding NarL/FixJ family response regulator